MTSAVAAHTYQYPIYATDLSIAQSNEGRAIRSQVERVICSFNSAYEAYSNLDDPLKKSLIKRVIAGCDGYASFSYILKKSRIDRADVERLLKDQKTFRESVMRTPLGEKMYILESRFGYYLDILNAFRYLNAVRS